MGESEQHEIIGRTVVQHGEAKKRLAALEAKAREYADCMRIVSQDLAPAGVVYTGSGSGLSGKNLISALDQYPDKIEVVSLMDELRAIKQRIESLAKSLREMGVTP